MGPMDHPYAIRVEGRRPLGAPRKRRRRDLPAKMTVHSTETPAGTGRAVIARLEWPYSLIADPVTRELYSFGPLDGTALSLRGTHARTGEKIETNHAGLMHPQVSIVGYASKMGDLTDDELFWLADVVFAPVLDLCEIPNVWMPTLGADSGVVLASTESPARLTEDECWSFNGVLYHQSWYGNDHWDPGALDVEKIAGRIHNRPPGKPPIRGSVTIDIIGLGDRGPQVRELQKDLNEWFDAGLVADGVFGPITETAVRAAQREIGTTVDGFWGPKSAGAFDTYKRAVAEAVVTGTPEKPPAPAPPAPEELDRVELAAKTIRQASTEIAEANRRLGDAADILDL